MSAKSANPKSELVNLISLAQQGLNSWLKSLLRDKVKMLFRYFFDVFAQHNVTQGQHSRICHYLYSNRC